MAKTRKANRKDLKKDDEFVSRGQEVVAWASQYSRQLVVLLIGLALVISMTIAVSIVSRSKAAAGATALGQALEIAERPILDAAEGVDLGEDAFPTESARTEVFKQALEELRLEHRGTPASALAATYLGKIALDEERYDDALTMFNHYLDEAPSNHKLRFSALEGVGVVHEAKEDLGSALEAYRRLVRNAPSFYVPFGLLHEARVLHALGRDEEARTTAQRVIDEHGESTASRQARSLLGRLPPEVRPSEGVAADTVGAG